ncbi:MAG TPA: ribonuclease domain-containing protein [Candidatus Nanopelagicales bacterium]
MVLPTIAGALSRCAMLRHVMRRWIAAVLLGVLALGGCATTTTQQPAAPAVAQQQAQLADLAPATATTDLPTMTVAQLPPEGIQTLELIEAGGPFPYSKDGATFGNREGILPDQPTGFYAEYTVETPGSDDRGARRIVGGDDGSRFYTDDHYASFREVVSG